MLTEGIPNADYHAGPELSRSTAHSLLGSCPAKVRHDLDNPSPTKSSALIMGGCTHGMVLEPHSVQDEYGLKPAFIDGSGPRTGAYKEAFAIMQDERPGVRWLTTSEWDTCSAMAESALGNAVLKDYMSDVDAVAEGSGHFELEGAKCKVRPDLYSPNAEVIVDLKTTYDASEMGFRKSVRNFGYAWQSCWYLTGMRLLGLKARNLIFVAVDKEPPHVTAAYALTISEIERRVPDMQQACRLWAECTSSGVWPGYADDVRTLDLSKWGGDKRRISLSQAARDFGVSRTFVYKLLEDHDIETKFIGNRRTVDFQGFANALRRHHAGRAA